jgi:hypothetical protein
MTETQNGISQDVLTILNSTIESYTLISIYIFVEIAIKMSIFADQHRLSALFSRITLYSSLQLLPYTLFSKFLPDFYLPLS